MQSFGRLPVDNLAFNKSKTQTISDVARKYGLSASTLIKRIRSSGLGTEGAEIVAIKITEVNAKLPSAIGGDCPCCKKTLLAESFSRNYIRCDDCLTKGNISPIKKVGRKTQLPTQVWRDHTENPLCYLRLVK